MNEVVGQICEWKEDDEMWKAQCGPYWVFPDEQTPVQNGMKYCPFCGDLLEEVGEPTTEKTVFTKGNHYIFIGTDEELRNSPDEFSDMFRNGQIVECEDAEYDSHYDMHKVWFLGMSEYYFSTNLLSVREVQV